jgi:hypothetical protein
VDLVVAWLAFPVVLLSLATGWGWAVARLCGVRLPRELVPPLGFAAIVVVSGLITLVPRAAHFATPVVVGGAAAGLAAAWPFARPSRAAAWPAAAATIVFAAYAAPIVLSGTATYAGYLTLDDTATLFAMTDRMLEHGRTVDGLAPSTYEATLATLVAGYPMGSLLPLGIGAALVGEDVAWVFQPYLAVIAALLALVLWRLLRSAVPRPWCRLVAVVVAAQPALLYAYGMWTGVKELTAALLVALAAMLAFERHGNPRLRSWLPLATAAAATIGALSVGGLVWLLPLAVWLLVFAVWQLVAATSVLRAGDAVAGIAVLLVLLVLTLPAVLESRRLFGDGHLRFWTDEVQLANLVQALNPLQTFGIWPAGDFRLRPDSFWPVIVLVCLVASLAIAGFVRSIVRRDALLGYAVCAAAGAVAYWIFVSPWIEAKAFAIASPAVLALAASGCAWLVMSGRRAEAVVVATLVAGGVLWSNVLAYRDVNLAPRDQLEELEAIGHDFAGQGPALMTEYQPVGVRHFLRGLDAEGASELRRRPVLLRDGTSLEKLQYANLDSFRLDDVLVYRTLVLRRSPFESRPPAPYELRRRGQYYEVWQRPDTFVPVAEHIPLGDPSHPAAAPVCSQLLQLAGRGASIAAVARNDPVLVLPVPAPGQKIPFMLQRGDRYSIWLAGSIRDDVDVLVDDLRIGGAGYHLNNEGQFVELAGAMIGPGRHELELRFVHPPLRPGVDGPDYGAGPLVVSVAVPRRAVSVIPPAQAKTLCGRALDWVEALQ